MDFFTTVHKFDKIDFYPVTDVKPRFASSMLRSPLPHPRSRIDDSYWKSKTSIKHVDQTVTSEFNARALPTRQLSLNSSYKDKVNEHILTRLTIFLNESTPHDTFC